MPQRSYGHVQILCTFAFRRSELEALTFLQVLFFFESSFLLANAPFGASSTGVHVIEKPIGMHLDCATEQVPIDAFGGPRISLGLRSLN